MANQPPTMKKYTLTPFSYCSFLPVVRVFIALSFAWELSAGALAGPAYRDTDGATPGGSSGSTVSGIWDQNNTTGWSSDASGSSSTTNYENAGGFAPDAVFSAGTDATGQSTVTISGSVRANRIVVEEGNIVFSGTNSAVLTLGGGGGAGISIQSGTNNNTSFGATVTSIVLNGAQTWDVFNNSNLSTNIATVVSGSGPLTVNGDPSAIGRVSLGGTNNAATFTGGVIVKGGTLAIDSSGGTTAVISSAGTGAITLGDSSGSRSAVLINNTNTNKFLNNDIVIAAGSAGLAEILKPAGNTNPTTYAGGITMNKDLSIVNHSTAALNISGTAGNALVANGNTLSLIASGTGNGNVVVTQALSGTGAVIVAAPGTATVTLNGSNGGWSGPIFLNSGTLNAGSTTQSVGGQLGTGPISMADGTTLSFLTSTTNLDYGNGTINVDGGTAVTINSTSTTARLIGISGMNVGGSGTGASVSFTMVFGAPTFNLIGPVHLSGDCVFSVTSGGPPGGFGSAVNFNGGATGTGSLTKTGTNVLFMGYSTLATGAAPAHPGVASTYTGDTNIAAGLLRIGQTNALPVATTVAIASGAMLDLSASLPAGLQSNAVQSNFDLEIAGLNDLGGSGGAVVGSTLNIANNGGSIGDRTLTLSGTESYAFSGTISDRPISWSTIGLVANNRLAVAKTGSGIQRLSAANAYTGGTTVNNGVLLVTNTVGSATGQGVVEVGPGGTFGGTGIVDGVVLVNGGGKLMGGDGSGTTGTSLRLPNQTALRDGSIIVLTLGAGGAHTSLDFLGRFATFDEDQAFDFEMVGGVTDQFYDNILMNLRDDPGTESSWVVTDPNNIAATFTFDGANIDVTVKIIPEPGSLALLLSGLGLLLFTRRFPASRRI